MTTLNKEAPERPSDVAGMLAESFINEVHILETLKYAGTQKRT